MDDRLILGFLPPDAALPVAILLAAMLLVLAVLMRRPAPDPVLGQILGRVDAMAAAQDRQANASPPWKATSPTASTPWCSTRPVS